MNTRAPGIGAGVRTAGQYQGRPSFAGAYGDGEPPPNNSRGPWWYSVYVVAPVAVMPVMLVDVLNAVRAAQGDAPGEA